MPDLSVDLAPGNKLGLRLRNPVLTASGTFGYGVEYQKLIDIQRLGAICSKGTTPRPRRGNDTPRIVETPAGMLNAIGLQNIGVDRVIREMAPIWARWQVPVIVNVAGETVEDYGRLAGKLDRVPGVAGLELNISCPNVTENGRVFADDPELAAAATAAARAATQLPLMVKLSPNVTDITLVARAVEAAGADAISMINTLVGMTIDPRHGRPVLANVTGGLSGPAIRPIALRMVWQAARVVRVPIVGIGGIATLEDALQFFLAGARAIQVGTATFVNPRAALDIVDGLERYLAEQGLEDITGLVGAANPGALCRVEATVGASAG
ncbi:MAG: dihydroorotate dehydrogenase [Chloroflexi bacterium]|nr:dihydroorotate dehydrogenase [Chloroflexota bacterium]